MYDYNASLISGGGCIHTHLVKVAKKILTAMITQYSSPKIDTNEEEDASEAWSDCNVCIY